MNVRHVWYKIILLKYHHTISPQTVQQQTVLLPMHIDKRKFAKSQKCVINVLTTMMAIRPPTSPTTVMGGFSLGINTRIKKRHSKLCDMAVAGFTVSFCVLALHGISMLGWMAPAVLTVGGECRPSTWSDSASCASPWITAIPRRSRSANDWALHGNREKTWDTRTTHCGCSSEANRTEHFASKILISKRYLMVYLLN